MGSARLVRWLQGPLTVRDPLREAESILVPGARVHRDGRMSRSALERVRAGAALHLQGWAPTLLLVGGSPDGGHVEAEAMAAEALRMGVPADAIVLETYSTNTWENADYAAVILRGRRVTSTILVTHPFHTRRMKRALLRHGVLAIAHPIDVSWMSGGDTQALRLVAREYIALGIDLLGGRR